MAKVYRKLSRLRDLAVGEVPVSGLALVAASAISVLGAVALTVRLPAEGVKGTHGVAVAGWNIRFRCLALCLVLFSFITMVPRKQDYSSITPEKKMRLD